MWRWLHRSLLESPPSAAAPTPRAGPAQISLADLLSGCSDCGSVSVNIDLGALGLGKIQANIPLPKLPPQPRPGSPSPAQAPPQINPPGITFNDLFNNTPQGTAGRPANASRASPQG
ncbi:hypothetical protein V8C86DRAFT_2646085 [Haematococcus lacustris]